MTQPEIHFDRFDTLEQASDFAAGLVSRCASDAVVSRQRFNIALAGGSTPVRLYEKITGSDYPNFPWSQTSIYFGDERCVEHSDDASNYRMASQALLRGLEVGPAAVYPMIMADPSDPLAAERYCDIIKSNIAENSAGVPQFDLVLLGIGDDGHTASLFPDEPELLGSDDLVVKTAKPHTGLRRISFTLKLINAARCVIILASGESKKELVEKAYKSAQADMAIDQSMASQHVRAAEKLHFVFAAGR